MNIQELLNDRHVAYEALFHRDTYDAQHLAHELHTSGHQVAKTVLLRADHGYLYIVAVLPASMQLDFDLVANVFGGSHIELASELEIKARCPDCQMGVLPPFGSRYGMKTVVDQTLADCDVIVFEGNSHHEAIRMRYEDFQHLEEPLVAEITAAPRGGR